MLTYDISQRGTTPIYEFLYHCVKNDILRGILCSNEKLPSKRAFAKNLGISVVTVEACYGQLLDEGYIYSVEKVGFFVAEIETLHSFRAEFLRKSHGYAENRSSHANQLGYAGNQLGYAGGENIKFNLATNQNCPDDFPFSVWAKIMRNMLSEKQEKLMQNSEVFGTFELRHAIARYIREFRGMNVNENQVIIGAGTEYLCGLLIQVLGLAKNYGVENPGYKKLFSVYKNHGVKCIPVGMDEKGVKVNEIENSEIEIMHVTPSHHFPTGYILSADRRVDLLNWAAAKDGRFIIEDDYDSEFRFSGNPISTLQSMGRAGKVIYINSFSKTVSPTIRISYIILPENLVEKFSTALQFYSCPVPALEQFSLAEFINEGFFERHINRMRKKNLEKRAKFIQSIRRFDKGGMISVLKEGSGLHFLIQLSPEINAAEFRENLLQSGVKISSLNEYYFDSGADENIFIVNYSSLGMNQIEEIAKILCEGWFKSKVVI